jgi:hypothetical protein
MSPPGDTELLTAARRVLLDALQALAAHRDALVVIGAQAIYLHTGQADIALAEATKDSDLAIDPRALLDDPRIEEAMIAAKFHRDLTHPQPGSWLSPDGIPVDLMVPEALAGQGGRRGARIPPHSTHATRRTPGLEAAIVDNTPIMITALDPADDRELTVAVAGPAALLIAKLHKIAERKNHPGRLIDKDAHDIYRLLVATSTTAIATRLRELAADELCGQPHRPRANDGGPRRGACRRPDHHRRLSRRTGGRRDRGNRRLRIGRRRPSAPPDAPKG